MPGCPDARTPDGVGLRQALGRTAARGRGRPAIRPGALLAAEEHDRRLDHPAGVRPAGPACEGGQSGRPRRQDREPRLGCGESRLGCRPVVESGGRRRRRDLRPGCGGIVAGLPLLEVLGVTRAAVAVEVLRGRIRTAPALAAPASGGEQLSHLEDRISPRPGQMMSGVGPGPAMSRLTLSWPSA